MPKTVFMIKSSAFTHKKVILTASSFLSNPTLNAKWYPYRFNRRPCITI